MGVGPRAYPHVMFKLRGLPIFSPSFAHTQSPSARARAITARTPGFRGQFYCVFLSHLTRAARAHTGSSGNQGCFAWVIATTENSKVTLNCGVGDYSGTPLNGHPSTTAICDITANSTGPDQTYVDFCSM